MLATQPVERLALNLAVCTRHATTGLWVVGGIDSGDVAFCILVTGVFLVALDDIGVLQSYLLARCQALELFLGHFLEVAALNPQLATKGNSMRAVSLVLRVVDSLHILILSFGIVGDDQLDGIEHGTDATGLLVQVVAHGGLQ